MIEAGILHRGSKFMILALRKPGAKLSYFGEYLCDQEKSTRNKMLYAVERLKDHGPPKNPEKGRKLKGDWGLWELKGAQWRVMWFYGPMMDGYSTILLASAFTKKQNQTPVAELERAAKRRALFFEKHGGH